MPVNRFDNPVGQRYVSTYVPLPYEELSAIAKQHQDKHDINRMLPLEFDKMASALKAAPIHQDKKDRLISGYKGLIDNAVNSTRDYASPEFQKKVTDILYQFRNDPSVQEIENTKNWWDKEYLPYRGNKENQRDLDFTVQKDESNSTGYKQTDKGVYSLNTTKYADAAKAAEDIMSNIRASGKSTGVWDLSHAKQLGNGYTEVYNKTTNSYEQISDAQVKDIAAHNVSLYGKTDAGLYRLREMLKPIYGDQVQSLSYDNLEKMTNSKIFNAVNQELQNDLSKIAYKQEFRKSAYDQDNKFLDNEGAKKKVLEDAVPVWNSPANTVEGLKVADDFDANAGYKGGITVGGPTIIGTASTPEGNITKGEAKYKQPREMDAKTKDFAEKAIQQLDPAAYKGYKATGVLSDAMMKNLYPQIKQMKAALEKDILVGSQVQGLNDTELHQMKGFFGSELQEVKDLGTGNGINATYYIPSTGETLTYAELKYKFPEDSKVGIKGKYTAANPFVQLTGNKDFANARQISIDGTEIVVTGPTKFINTKNGANAEQNYELVRNRAVNEIYNAKFTPTMPKDINVYGEKIKVMYVPDNNNPDAGTYNILDHKGDILAVGLPTVDEAEQAVYNLAKERQ